MAQVGEFLINMLGDVVTKIAFSELNNAKTRKLVEASLLEAFPLVKVICDDTLNTPESIDKCELWFSLEYLETKVICRYHGEEVNLKELSVD